MSELVIGIALFLGIFTDVAALAGVCLNFIYILSGAAGVNPVYAAIGIALVLAWRNAGHLGLDRVALRSIGTPSHPGSLVRHKLSGSEPIEGCIQ